MKTKSKTANKETQKGKGSDTGKRAGNKSVARQAAPARSSNDLDVPEYILDLHESAVRAREKAYAPYSKFMVGAALLGKNNGVYSGCNIENASYGGTVCAERTAILKAVSEGARRFGDIVVVTDRENPAAPCGLCLQVMAEFFDPDTKIWVASCRQVKSVYRFSELLPVCFGPRDLQES